MLSFFKKSLSILIILSVAFVLFGCGNKTEEIKETTSSFTGTTAYKPTEGSKSSSLGTAIVLDDDRTEVNINGAEYSNGILKITKAGTYNISGKLSDGYIYVNTSDTENKVRLVFSGVDIYSSLSSPVFIESSPKETQIILEDGFVNNLSDNKDRVLSESEIASDDYSKAVIFSRDDLQIEGTGILNINAEFEKGIFSKDDLQIKDAAINITAKDDGIRGKDSVEISNSTINVTSGGDGIRSSNETDAGKGDITVTNSNLTIASDLDGIQSVGNLAVSYSTLTVTTANGASDDMTSAVEDVRGGFGKRGGFDGRHDPFEEQQAEEATVSTKGIKAAKDMNIVRCSINVNSVDDAFHCDKSLTIDNSTVTAKTNDDGIHSELSLKIKYSSVSASLSYEGIESQEINIDNSTIDITATDDGLNAAIAEDRSENPAFSGQTVDNSPPEKPGGFGYKSGMRGMGEYNSDCQIKINSSTLCVKAEGDGIDSNGDIEVNGSVVIVYGPSNGGNGSLDYAGKCITENSNLIAAGSSGMAQTVSDGSDPTLSFTCGTDANTLLTITDEHENDIISFCSPKQYNCVIFSSYKLEKGKTYNVYVGGTNQGTEHYGIYSGEKTENATLLGSLTAS